jgi:transcription elongation factor Elf1
MEIETEIKIIKVKYQCPFCKKGFMEHNIDRVEFMSNYFIHTCNNCNQEINLEEIYPLYRKI